MTVANQAELEQELVEFLGELSELQHELLTVLRKKREHLATGNLPAMQELQSREELLIERLNECQQRRHLLLEAARNQGMKRDNLANLATSIQRPDGPDLGKQVRELNVQMRILQNGTLTNWLLAQRTLLHLSQLVEIIATGGRMQPTYVMGDSVHARGALLDQEA